MRNMMIISGVLLAIVFALGLPAVARQSNIWTSPSQVHFESLTLADGLYDSTIFSIAQDGNGQLWFGTAAGGANSFDGYRVHAFLHDPTNPESLSHSAAGEVLATRDGTVLVGTWGGGVNRYLGVDDTFERLNPGAAPTQIQIMFEDSKQRVWIGSADSGLYVMDDPRGSMRPVMLPNGRPYPRVWGLSEDDHGAIWVATEAGLFDLEGRTLTPGSGWHGHPRTLMHDGQTLWVGDAQTVYQVVDGQPLAVLKNIQRVNTLALSPNGQVLVGTMAGMRALDMSGQSVSPFGRSEQVLFPDRNIRRFFFDHSGVGWIATREAGVILALPEASGFDGFRLQSNLNTADTLFELSPSDVLIGSRRGLWRLQRDQSQSVIRHIAGTESLSINRLARLGNEILVGSYSGVLLFDPITEQLRDEPRFAALTGLGVTSLQVWDDGRVDLGTWTDGLYRFSGDDPPTHYVSHGENPIGGGSISDIEPDSAGGIWLGLWNEGITHIDRDGIVTDVEHDELGIEGHVHDLLLVDDELWVATSFGLARFDTVTRMSQRISLIPEFPNTAVQRLAMGPDRLWASTTRGVITIDRETRAISRYRVTDGLVIEEFFARSGHVGSEGRVYFGGLGGLVSFIPQEVALDVSPPEAAIIGIWVEDTAVPVQETIVIPPGVSALRLRHVVADYRSPESNRFRWRLLGRSEAWSKASPNPETLLTGLKPGEYGFELQAANANGVWNESAAVLSIRVMPAWWQTPWGVAAVLLGLFMVAYLWNYWNTARIRVRNRELAAEVNRQTRALREANRSLAQVASTDHLTGLLNRRGFLAQVETTEASLSRWFVILDVDNFKQFNDRYGHDVGDQVLSHVAQIIQQAAPSGTQVARWGGEEFILHFQAANEAAAIEAADHVRQAVKRQPLERIPAIPAITVTAGLARMSQGESCIRTINRADARLLRGKVDGKNRLVTTGHGLDDQRD